MIRPTDLPLNSLWPRAAAPAPRAEASDAASWFRTDGDAAMPRIAGDFNPACRGLSAGEHAQRVLAHLCGAANERA